MKTISLWQPWATLMAAGYKRIETRSWQPRGLQRGQLVAIHAARHWTEEERDLIEWDDLFQLALRKAQERGLWEFDHPPLGCVVAIARYYGAKPTSLISRAETRETHGETPSQPLSSTRWWLPEREFEFGNFSEGRYGWAFSEVRPINPIPLRGERNLFDWTPPADLTYLEASNRSPFAAPAREVTA